MSNEELGLRLVEPSSYATDGYPHEAWARLRRDSPVEYFDPPGWPPFWAITRHADIREISRRPSRFLNAPGMSLVREEQARERQSEGAFGNMRTIINMDPPDHRKYRAVVSPWFTPRALRRIDAMVVESAKRLVDGLGSEGECDFVTEVASLHPLRILARVLGVPEADEPFILKLTNELFGSEDPEFRRSGSRKESSKALGADFHRYFTEVMEDRRRRPRDDLASVIANARIDGDPMGEIETLGYCLITFTAGHETTRGGIAGGLFALLEHPDQRRRWAQDPALTPRAIEEILRWVTPVNTMVRTAAEDCEIGGRSIRAGDRLVLFYASANRDESVFDSPFELRLDRHPNPHLAFGIGEHFCVGSHFARRTSAALFTELVTRFESVELAGEPQRTASNLVPGLKHLPIRYRLAHA